MSWKRFLTEGMRKDLDFYIAHSKELYFYGMVIIALSWLFIMAAGVFIVFSNTDVMVINTDFAVGKATTDYVIISDDTTWWIVGVLFMLSGAMGFGIVKMYLHIRKDAIEIKEQLVLCGWDHK